MGIELKHAQRLCCIFSLFKHIVPRLNEEGKNFTAMSSSSDRIRNCFNTKFIFDTATAILNAPNIILEICFLISTVQQSQLINLAQLGDSKEGGSYFYHI